MTTHRIRLHGPWQLIPIERLPESGPLPAPLQITIPSRWREHGWSDFSGRVRYLRRFGKPTGLTEADQVQLVFEGLTEKASVHINGHVLGEIIGAGQFDISQLLLVRNELAVELLALTAEGGLWGSVYLEIISP